MIRNHPDNYFMNAASSVARWSSTLGDKVGAVLVTPDVVFLDRCDFPEGILKEKDRFYKPEWFIWSDHAERRVIYSAARYGVSTEGATMYVSWFPCVECAKAISQSGIKRIVGIEPDWDIKRWNFKEARKILEESKVKITFYEESNYGRSIDKTVAA